MKTDYKLIKSIFGTIEAGGCCCEELGELSYKLYAKQPENEEFFGTIILLAENGCLKIDTDLDTFITDIMNRHYDVYTDTKIIPLSRGWELYSCLQNERIFSQVGSYSIRTVIDAGMQQLAEQAKANFKPIPW